MYIFLGQTLLLAPNVDQKTKRPKKKPFNFSYSLEGNIEPSHFQ